MIADPYHSPAIPPKMNPSANFLKSKWLWTSLASVLLVAGLVLFFGSRILYANPAFQQWIQNQIASQTQGAFQFKSIGGGFVSARLEDLSLDLKGTPFNVQKVRTPVMKASFAWIPLLQNRLVIHSLAMEGGRIDIRMAGSAPGQTALPVSSSFQLENGTVSVSNFAGWSLEMTGCDLKARQSGNGAAQAISGKVSASRAKLGNLVLEDIESRFRLENGRFYVEKLRATLPGKSTLELSGSYALDGKPLLETDLVVDSPDIHSLLQALDFSDRFSGRAKVTAKASGLFTPASRSLTGTGDAVLKEINPDIALPRFPVFNNAPIFKRIQDIDDLEGRAAFQLAQDKILVRELALKNAEIKVTGTAQIGYDRSLSSSLVFNGSKTVAAEIPAIGRSAFSHDSEGHVIIPFQLKPDTRNPQADVGDVVNRVLSNQIKGLNPLQFLK